jgi:hypothetical protein
MSLAESEPAAISFLRRPPLLVMASRTGWPSFADARARRASATKLPSEPAPIPVFFSSPASFPMGASSSRTFAV